MIDEEENREGKEGNCRNFDESWGLYNVGGGGG